MVMSFAKSSGLTAGAIVEVLAGDVRRLVGFIERSLHFSPQGDKFAKPALFNHHIRKEKVVVLQSPHPRPSPFYALSPQSTLCRAGNRCQGKLSLWALVTGGRARESSATRAGADIAIPRLI